MKPWMYALFVVLAVLVVLVVEVERHDLDAALEAGLLDGLAHALLAVGRNVNRRKVGVRLERVLRDFVRIVVAVEARLKRQRADFVRIIRVYRIKKAV